MAQAGSDGATIEVSHENGIVTVAVQGRITPPVGDEVVRRGLETLRSTGARALLHDFRRARIMETTLQLIRRIRFATDIGVPADARVALLCSVRTPDLDFFESLAQSHGVQYRTFTDGAAALEWLRAAGPAPTAPPPAAP